MSKALPDFIFRYRYWLTATGSLLSSLILVSQRVLVNTDGVVYLAAAQRFLEDGLAGALAINPNFFLGVLIACLSNLTGTSLLVSGDIINAVLHAGVCVSFVWLVQQLGGTARMQVIAAVLILLHPSLTGFRESIFRDPGYWMCCLFSLGLLLQFARTLRQHLILLWTLSLGIGALFRPEAAIFFLAPLAFLLDKSKVISARIRLVTQVFIIPVGAGGVVLLLLVLSGNTVVLEQATGHLARYIDYARITFDSYGSLIDGFNTVSPFEYPEDFLWLAIILFLAPIFLSAMIGSLGDWPILFLFGFCKWKGSKFSPHSPIFTTYCVISLVIVLCFLGLNFFLDTRYTTLLSLLLIALLPSALDQLFEKIKEARWVKPTVITVIVILLIDTFYSFGYSTAYLNEGVDWVNANTPEGSSIVSNERKLTYSFNRQKIYEDSEAVYGGWRSNDVREVLDRYDYFAEDVFWDEEELTPVRYPDAEEVARFTSERGNRLVIYRLR